MDLRVAAWKLSIPMVISMISIALYGIVDAIFIANLGEKALNAISLSYPIQNLVTAIGLGVGIGTNVVLSKAIGEKNEEKSKKIIIHGIKVTLCAWTIIAILSILGIKGFFNFFTSDEEIISLGYSYLIIIMVLSIGAISQILFEKILEAYGKTKESMLLQICGAIINLILDPLMIYGMIGFPNLGIVGAAVATVIGQMVAMLIGAYFILKYKIIEIKNFTKTKNEKLIFKSILGVGIPTMLMEVLTSLIIILLNKILIGFSENAVSVWGIYIKVEKFVFIMIYGFNYGMMPMLGYCLGAKKESKVKEIIQYFYKISLIISILGMIVFIVFPAQMINWFGVASETLTLGILAFRILALSFVFEGTSIFLSAVFQCYEKANYSLIISLLRKLLISVPIILLLKNKFGLNIVWWAFSFGEIISAVVAVILYKYNIRKNIEV